MKLVELLAREITKWPTDGFKVKYLTQDSDGWICSWEDDGPLIFCGTEWKMSDSCPVDQITREELANDYKDSIVTRSEWQAERDRQKGGEWKRHRGGKQPVADDVVVEYKLRNGYTDTWHARALSWSHAGGEGDVMKYRVISQPQAEEVDSISEAVHKPIIEALNSMAAEWYEDQIDGPIKWRDQIVELEAHAEDIQREIASLFGKLNSEGFQLIRQYPSVSDDVPDVDMSDWRNWKAGDIVECVTGEYTGVYTKGRQYKVEWVKEECFSVYDDFGGESSCDWFDHDAEGLKFVSRP